MTSSHEIEQKTFIEASFIYNIRTLEEKCYASATFEGF